MSYHPKLNFPNEEAKHQHKLMMMADWRRRNPNRRKEWDDENRAHVSEYRKRYSDEHKDRRKQTIKAWRQRKRAHVKAYKIKWNQNNPEKYKASNMRRWRNRLTKFSSLSTIPTITSEKQATFKRILISLLASIWNFRIHRNYKVALEAKKRKRNLNLPIQIGSEKRPTFERIVFALIINKAKQKKEKLRECCKKWRTKNRLASRFASRKWAKENPERVKKNIKSWRESESGKRKVAAQYARWYPAYYQSNKEKIKVRSALWNKQKCASDPIYRMIKSFRTRIQTRVKKENGRAPIWDLLGCTAEDFRKHLKSQFKAGMDFDNYGFGSGKWVVDHIKPIASFDMRNQDHQRKCWHYSNLQPLWLATIPSRHVTTKCNRL